jgi:riboflavin biosynthesis pyrimidine reductase
MFQIWPAERAGHTLDDSEVERLYAYPEGPSRWLAVNFVSSADGAVTLGESARGLSTPADRDILQLGSDLADVLLVGATTAMVENFRGVHPDKATLSRRRRYGLADTAVTAVVTTGRLPPDAPVITEASVPTLVFTCATASASVRDAWTAAGAEVLVCGQDTVDLVEAVGMLTARGLRRIDCEGGPQLFGHLIAAGLVDELRLTLSPQLVAGTAQRIAASPSPHSRVLRLASVLGSEDGTLLMRYLPRP